MLIIRLLKLIKELGYYVKHVNRSDISDFMTSQNQFSIDYLISKQLIDTNHHIINREDFVQNPIFRSWIQNKHIDFELEKKQYEEMIKLKKNQKNVIS